MMTPDEIMALRSRATNRATLYCRNQEGRAGLDPIAVEELLDDVARALLEFAEVAAEDDGLAP
jgi:hypothetical protein